MLIVDHLIHYIMELKRSIMVQLVYNIAVTKFKFIKVFVDLIFKWDNADNGC